MVVGERIVAYTRYTTRDSDAGELVIGERANVNTRHPLWDGNTSELVASKGITANTSYATWDGDGSELVAGEGTTANTSYATWDGDASERLVRECAWVASNCTNTHNTHPSNRRRYINSPWAGGVGRVVAFVVVVVSDGARAGVKGKA